MHRDMWMVSIFVLEVCFQLHESQTLSPSHNQCQALPRYRPVVMNELALIHFTLQYFSWHIGTWATLHVRRVHHRWFWVCGKPSTRTRGTWTPWRVPLRKSAKTSPARPLCSVAAGTSRTQNLQISGRSGQAEQMRQWQTLTAWRVMRRRRRKTRKEDGRSLTVWLLL